jgi:hypothetical protein
MVYTTNPFNDCLDVGPSRGQRTERFVFQHINGVTGQVLGVVNPDRTTPPVLTHDTTGAIKRRLTMNLNEFDTPKINPIQDRILPFCIICGVTYPLGRYMFTTPMFTESTGGERGQFTLLDEGFIIDQQLESPYASTAEVGVAIRGLLATGTFTFDINVPSTEYAAVGAFTAGQTRGQGLDTYATQGDYMPYWMNNAGEFQMVRTVDPATAVPDFDYDLANNVKRDTITRTTDILDAPNRFIVISNSGDAANTPIVGTYDVPNTAPFSVVQRGFVVPSVVDLQSNATTQATAMARNLGLRKTVFDRVTLDTMLDPRHDSYNVIHFLGENWLELGWTMNLFPGGAMQHVMRKGYQSTS